MDDSPARRALARLFRLGEQAQVRGADKPVQMPMTAAKCPEYVGLQPLRDFETFESEIALAVRAGAIVAEPEDFGRDDRRLQRLRLRDLAALAAHLGLPLQTDALRAAEAAFAEHRAAHPVLDEVLARWRSGRRVRGQGAEAADTLLDAIRAVDARRADPAQERLLRRESVRLFGDSKRLESLTRWLDLLLTGEPEPSGLEQAQIWSALGLRREPQPVLIAGRGEAVLDDGALPLRRPYLGLPVDAVRTLNTTAQHLLTIENLTSFHDAARALGDGDGLLLYTGGMPSPPWRAFYARVLHGLPASTRLHHWGDIDEGGFRIAAVLAAVAAEAGKALQPWRMSPRDAPPGSAIPTATALEKMIASAQRAGWHDLATELQANPVCVEQEAMDAVLP
jgi:hypothetical protein